MMKKSGDNPPPKFGLPEIFKVNLDSLSKKKWREPGAVLSDYFNYGFREETWKLYSELIREHEDLFQQIFESSVFPQGLHEGNATERTPIFHPNSELNFNLPVDMGGLGPLYNKSRYSRVNFFPPDETPILKVKSHLNDCYLTLEETVPDANYINAKPIVSPILSAHQLQAARQAALQPFSRYHKIISEKNKHDWTASSLSSSPKMQKLFHDRKHNHPKKKSHKHHHNFQHRKKRNHSRDRNRSRSHSHKRHRQYPKYA